MACGLLSLSNNNERTLHTGGIMKPVTHPALYALKEGVSYSSMRRISRRRVLFAMSTPQTPTLALQRAHSIAQTLGRELLVLGIMPEVTRASSARLPFVAALQALEAAKEVLRETRAFCERVLPEKILPDNIIVQHGAFLPSVVGLANEYDLDLIVLPSEEAKNGQRITKMARLTQTPVMIARRPGLTQTIVAASDLEDGECPILKRANQLSHSLRAPMVLVHNLHPSVGIETEIPSPEKSRARQLKLQYNTKRLAPEAEPVLLSASNTVDAILHVARQKCADMLVVGAYRRGWVERVISSGTAAQLAERAELSVLVTPLS
jgi:nucleotide-binding universal stress UspA family protein